jgi:hypothetical protein
MQDPNVQLWCEDEVHFPHHGTLTRMWASKGHQLHILTPSYRHKVAFMVALNLKSGHLPTQEAPTFSAQTFGDFLKQLLQVTSGKLCLILDNA